MRGKNPANPLASFRMMPHPLYHYINNVNFVFFSSLTRHFYKYVANVLLFFAIRATATLAVGEINKFLPFRVGSPFSRHEFTAFALFFRAP